MPPCETRNDRITATDNPVKMVECSIRAFGSVNLSNDELTAIRKVPEPHLGLPMAASFARHCDEQTLAALSAVAEAIRQLGTQQTDFESWGIVASSRYLGRSFLAQTLDNFDREGPWNAPTQGAANRSLHSPSGTVSLLLGCCGPNVGVGGGADGEGQALLTAMSMLYDGSLPGVWLLFSGWSPELNVDGTGQPTTDARCQALAVALEPASQQSRGLRLRVVPDFEVRDSWSTTRTLSWLSLLTTVLHLPPQNFNLIAPICDGLRAELVWASLAAVASSESRPTLRAAG